MAVKKTNIPCVKLPDGSVQPIYFNGVKKRIDGIQEYVLTNWESYSNRNW